MPRMLAARAFKAPSISVKRADDTLLKRFDSHFTTLPADTPERVQIAQKIRYQVYCVENPHERADNPEGVETDEFDSHAVHSILVYRDAHTALGTVRLILPLPEEPDSRR